MICVLIKKKKEERKRWKRRNRRSPCRNKAEARVVGSQVKNTLSHQQLEAVRKDPP
jgi:hypothetical protein